MRRRRRDGGGGEVGDACGVCDGGQSNYAQELHGELHDGVMVIDQC